MNVAASSERRQRARRRRAARAAAVALLALASWGAASADVRTGPPKPAKPNAISRPAPAPDRPSGGAPAVDFSNMTTYWFGLLSRGPEWTPEKSARIDSLQAGHRANMFRMWQEGRLLGAGPFVDDGPMRGVFVFRSDSLEALRRETAKDPMIAAGRLRLDLWRWFAPKGLGERYHRRAKEHPGRRDSMVVVQLAFLRAGAAEPAPEAEMQRLQLEHVRNIFRLIGSGTMPMGGPFADAGEIRGVCIFTLDADSARRQLADDPFVRRGHLAVDQHPLWIADGVLP